MSSDLVCRCYRSCPLMKFPIWKGNIRSPNRSKSQHMSYSTTKPTKWHIDKDSDQPAHPNRDPADRMKHLWLLPEIQMKTDQIMWWYRLSNVFAECTYHLVDFIMLQLNMIKYIQSVHKQWPFWYHMINYWLRYIDKFDLWGEIFHEKELRFLLPVIPYANLKANWATHVKRVLITGEQWMLRGACAFV